jgi:hypothetical protein
MHGRRALAAAAGSALLISLFAPWYRETIVARGLTGLRTMTVTRSGWEAFSFTEALVLVVAVLALVVVTGVPVAAAPEGRPRLRLSGVLVGVLGTIAFVVVLARLWTAPGTTRDTLSATMVAIRWGIFLALGSSALLAVSGLRLIRAPRSGEEPAAGPARRGDRPGWPASPPTRSQRAAGRDDRAPGAARPDRAPRSSRPDRAPRSSRPDRAPRTPRADRGPRTSRAERPSRPERPRPTRHADRPRWEEEPTGWLDLPD